MWTPLPPEWRAGACAKPGSVLLESSLPSETEHHSLLFTHPTQILTANTQDDLPAIFERIEEALKAGQWAAGYMAYEAGSHFLDLPPATTDGPIALFGIFDKPQTFDHHRAHTGSAATQATKLCIAPMPQVTVAVYRQAIHQTHEWIAAGETYQVNYTMQLQSPCAHPSLDVYNALSAQQHSSFAAIVTLDPHRTILSFSPELFFRVDSDGVITTKPMKGTAPRGSTPEEDQRLAQALQRDEKNRAEHVMIVDLLRNDLNRICRTGTVCADDLFHIEQYETVHQMTSRVSGKLPPQTPWYEVFRALFPGGSITGAPKRHTTELIAKIEPAPRGVYTGAIGYFAPDRTACLNIAIRTAVLESVDEPACPKPVLSLSKDGEAMGGNRAARDQTIEDRHPELNEAQPLPLIRHPERNEAQRSAVEGPDFLSSPIQPAESHRLTLGVGGGIVADSTAHSEYNEALLKAAFMYRAAEPYHLIETMRADQGKIAYLEDHLQRLATSAEALAFTCDIESIRSQLAAIKTETEKPKRVRLQLHRNGHTEVSVVEAPFWPEELHLTLSPQQTNASSPHLLHKTTFRPEYNEAHTQAIAQNFNDTLFTNTHGEVTESCIANLLVCIDNCWYTPPIASGVLPGILRAHLLKTRGIHERIITLDDLRSSTAAALCNALRGTAPIVSLLLTSGERIRWQDSQSLSVLAAW